MKLRIILFALISFPFLWSCDKKEIPVFASDDAGIYFQRLTNAVYGSTTEYYGDSTDFLLPERMLIIRVTYCTLLF